MSDTTKRYQLFFKESQEGQDFVNSLAQMIDSEHQKAETEPELAQAYTQRAKGIREVVNKINGLCTDAKKGQAKLKT